MKNITSILLKVNIHEASPIFYDETQVIYQYLVDIGKERIWEIEMNYETENIFDEHYIMIHEVDDNIEESVRSKFTK